MQGRDPVIATSGKDHAMRHDQSVMDKAKNPPAPQTKNVTNQRTHKRDGTDWIFPLLMAIIGLGVLGLILKSLGVL
jgi:hypothetical protein